MNSDDFRQLFVKYMEEKETLWEYWVLHLQDRSINVNERWETFIRAPVTWVDTSPFLAKPLKDINLKAIDYIEELGYGKYQRIDADEFIYHIREYAGDVRAIDAKQNAITEMAKRHEEVMEFFLDQNLRFFHINW